MAYTTIDKPTDYFNTKLYTGTGSSHAVSGIGFQPDWCWIKCRDDSHNHQVFDSVRGVHKRMRTDTTGVETSSTESLKSFDSTGFTLGTQANVNNPSNTFVSWNWLAGTSVSGNTTGSGTSKAYTGSVNTNAGFSIIKYIGNGTAGHQIPHHLNAVPKMLILKNITGGSENWFVYHASLGNTKDIHLDNDGAGATADSWNNTTPSTTTWTMSDQSAINSTDGNDHIAYCFSEVKGFSKAFSYTGNGNSNGSYIHLGFRSSFIMIKRVDSGSNAGWLMFDNKRLGYNGGNSFLEAHNSATESSAERIDILSSGFKNRSTTQVNNASGGSYIGIAFAENPFVTSTGIPTTAR